MSMKKILTLCAALMAAMSMSAAITNMTCAEAKSAAMLLQPGQTGTDSVAVTGYVTNTNGSISRGQQTFWLDDTKGSAQTFQAYWCNMPLGNDDTPLVVGDKVTIKGFLMNYNGTTAEMKNGDVVVLERTVVHYDTIAVDACEAVEEGLSLNPGSVSDDYFLVHGIVSQVDRKDDANNQETFWIDCNDSTRFEAYYVTIQPADAELAGFAEIGDSVEVLGKLTNYNGTIEIANGKAWVLAKGHYQPKPAIRVTVAQAVAYGMDSLARGVTSKDEFLVVGYVDSIAYAWSEAKKSMSFFMCDDLQNPTYNFEVYNGKTDVDVPVGTKVYCTGKIQHYYKAASGEKAEVELIELASGGTISLTEPSALSNVAAEQKGLKVLENGQLYIIKDNVKYSVLGVEVK